MSAVASLPSLAQADDTARMPLGYDDLGAFALSFSQLANIFHPRDIGLDAYHTNLFAGTVVALLAIVGVFRRQTIAVYAGALAVLTLMFMLHTPVTFVVHAALPGFEHFKPLARAAFLFQFALAVLAAFGLDTIGRRLGRARSGRLSLGRVRLPAATAVVAASLAAAVVLDAHRLSDFLIPHQPNQPRYLFPSTPLIRFLQRQDEARFLATDGAFLGSTAMIHALDSAGGYENVPPRRTENFWRVLGNGLSLDELAANRLIYALYPRYTLSTLRPELLARAAVQYVVAPPATVLPDAVPPGLELRYDGRDGRVFAVPGSLPRAYVAGNCIAVDAPLEALSTFIGDGFGAERAVILERPSFDDPPRCVEGAGGRVGQALVVDRSADSLHVLVNAEQAGWLIVTDTWDPGWKATLDGRRADVVPANYAYRAIAVPAGTHSVRLTFVPVGYHTGALISTATLTVTVGGLAWALLRRRRGAT